MDREVSIEDLKKYAKKIKAPYIECSNKESNEDEIEEIFIKLLKEVYKEDEDLFPYNIKNSTLKMNFIRKNHKDFNSVFIILLSLIIVSLKFVYYSF